MTGPKRRAKTIQGGARILGFRPMAGVFSARSHEQRSAHIQAEDLGLRRWARYAAWNTLEAIPCWPSLR